MPPWTVIDLTLCRQLSRRAVDRSRRRQNPNLIALQVRITTWLESRG